MPRYFNTAGPCDPGEHYLVPPEPRLPEARELIEKKGYFVLHAPRQTGKTTTLRALAKGLTAEGRFAALHFTCEEASVAGDDYGAAMRAILYAIRTAAENHLPTELWPPPFPEAPKTRLPTPPASPHTPQTPPPQRSSPSSRAPAASPARGASSTPRPHRSPRGTPPPRRRS
jgi:hypothetical protein